MSNLHRVSVLIAGLLFCLPAWVRADNDCYAASSLRGPVKTVLVSEGKVVTATGAIRMPPHQRQRIDVSRGRRTARIVRYEADGGSLWPLFNVWPTISCDFDDAGRVTRVRRKMSYLTTDTRVEMAYDAQGRPARKTSRSNNPEITYDNVYDHSAKTVTTVSPEGGVNTNDMTALDTDPWLPASAIPLVRDPACEYDRHGNWTRCVNPPYMPRYTPPTSISDLTIRDITYWP